MISRHLSNPWPFLFLITLFLYFVSFPQPRASSSISESSLRPGSAGFPTPRLAVPGPRVRPPCGLEGRQQGDQAQPGRRLPAGPWGVQVSAASPQPPGKEAAAGRPRRAGVPGRFLGVPVTHPQLSPLSCVGWGQRPRWEDRQDSGKQECSQWLTWRGGKAAHRHTPGQA